MPFEDLFWVSGLLFWLYVGVQIFCFLWKRRIFFKGGGNPLNELKGEWAIVTGSSYGIGKAFAFGLAARGFNLILIARSIEQLQKVADELKQKFGVEVLVIAADFLAYQKEEKETHPTLGEGVYEKLFQKLEGLTISVLVNNVGGIPGEVFKEYEDWSWEEEESLRYLNNVPAQKLIHFLLPKMKQRRKGVILNISSLASIFAVLLVPYATAKGALNSLTLSLAGECRKHNVTIQGVLCGEVSTEKLTTSPNILCCTATRFAEDTLRSLGGVNTLSTTYFGHELGYILGNLIPDSIRDGILFKETKRIQNTLHNKKQQ